MSGAPTIILYDLPSIRPKNAWSPNTWKARYVLNYKGLAYQTVWVEYPDIAELYKKNGVEACMQQDGAPHYTLPLLHDSTTGRFVADSMEIARYLDSTYPDTVPVFPYNTDALISAFVYVLTSTTNSIGRFVVPHTVKILNPRSAEYFRRTREIAFGKTLEDVAPRDEERVKQWNMIKDSLGRIAGWLKDDKYLLKDTLCFGDIVAASYLNWTRIVLGEDSQEWADISSWHDGRWGALLSRMELYETVA